MVAIILLLSDCLCSASKGHLFIDLIPETSQMYALTDDEAEIIGKRFERATREYLDIDEDHVVRIVCDRDMCPDYITSIFVSHLKKVNPTPKQCRSMTENNERFSTRESSYQLEFPFGPRKYSLTQESLRTQDGIPDGNNSDSLVSDLEIPVVFILQDIDLLCHEAQMTLVEMMALRTIPLYAFGIDGADPMSHSQHAGQDLTNSWESSIMVVALSGVLQTPSMSYSFTRNSASNRFSSDENTISLDLYHAFHLRAPIQLPKRGTLIDLNIGTTKKAYPLNKEKSNIDNPERDQKIKEHGARSGESSSELYDYKPFLWPRSTEKSSKHEEVTEEKKNISRNPLQPKHTFSGLNIAQYQVWWRFVSFSHYFLTICDFNQPIYLRETKRGAIEKKIQAIHISIEMERYLRDVFTAVRMSSYILRGPDMEARKILRHLICTLVALTENRYYVTPLDVSDVVVEALSHRIVLLLDSFPQIEQRGLFPSEPKSNPTSLHPLTASRLVIAHIVQYSAPTPR